jgi:ribosome biogenesis ATPase
MRVVNQLLTEMDGVEERQGVFLMAATNRPDIIDPAVMRPGRLDKILYVGLPEDKDREDILRALTKNGTKPPVAGDVNFSEIAQYTVGYTGADLAGLVRQASLQSLKSSIISDAADNTDNLTVQRDNFLQAFKSIKPSVNEEVSWQIEFA